MTADPFGTPVGRRTGHRPFGFAQDRPPTPDSPDICLLDEAGWCVTCSDEALPARVIAVDPALALATVEVNSRAIEVDISLVDGVAPGQLLLIHGGMALGRLDENENESNRRV